jgi:Peptidase family M28/PA domain
MPGVDPRRARRPYPAPTRDRHAGRVTRWPVLLSVAVLAALVALVLANRDGGEDRDGPARAAPADSPAPRAATRRERLGAHLRALQRIADEHGGTRAAGSPGDAATADYIDRRLRAAGYRVTRQRFRIPFYRETAPPRLRVDGRSVQPIRTLQFSPGGTASSRIRSAGLGCSPGEFDALREGEIALVRRGGCFFLDKALGAQRAGAAAALVVDQQPRPVAATLQRPGLQIPVLALGASAGERLEGRRATLTVEAVSARRGTASVIAESGPPDAPRIVMAGGHLDSVPAGPGLNDNGSGVAALVHVAERLGDRDLPLRFAFWGAEEIGLVGSRRYVDGLARSERRRIAAYLNLDMVGSPDSRPRVYDGGPVEDALRRHLPRRTGDATLDGSSDHAPFERAGIPVGGIFTGLDDCYHRRCDTLRNVDRDVLALSARATERALVDLAGG